MRAALSSLRLPKSCHFLGFILTSVVILPTSSYAEWYYQHEGIMGTDVSLALWHSNPVKARELISASMAELHRLDEALSPWIETSELAVLNKRAAAEPQVLSDELYALIDKSLYFSELSAGAFDITFASLGWYYDYRAELQPTEDQRKALLPAINYRWLDLNPTTRSLAYKHKNVRIDLGGIAKGYAVDRVASILYEGGVRHGTVSAGGDSRIIGDKRGKPWMIGIKNPRTGEVNTSATHNSKNEPAILLPLENTAISTSGDYERFFIDKQSGERIHHIINPRTGKSVKGVVSVTILGPTGSDTDPLSTTVFVLGVERGLALVNGLKGFDAVIIDSAGTVHYSDGLAPP